MKGEISSQVDNFDEHLDSGENDSEPKEPLTIIYHIKKPHSLTYRFVRDVILVALIALFLTVIVRMFFFLPFGVPSSSMEPTIKPGERLMVSKVSKIFGIHHNDIIVFEDRNNWLNAPEGKTTIGDAIKWHLGISPENEFHFLVKRVIGVEGDVVKCSPESGVTINDKQLNEFYISSENISCDDSFISVVPEGAYWVMGDNRKNSADSRLHALKGNGFVFKDHVVGIAFMKIWPLSQFGFMY
ncbi:MAG: signal peptidase I [Candidatus Ancillula sp.]|jgi:signal peptidase I|nr:signal peptidase I [Candidatus Ancillula sp.]